MTTAWQPQGQWKGATVAVLASGPSMSAELAQSLREHRTIVVNFACRAAPWADMLVALDGNWPQELREFAGMRVTGVADEDLDALYVGHRSERIMLTPSHQIEVRNSGLMAVRIAAEMGAARIMLAGFDPGEAPPGEYPGLAEGLRAITSELQARGLVVEHAQPLAPEPAVVVGDGSGEVHAEDFSAGGPRAPGWFIAGERGVELEPLAAPRKKR